MSTIKILPEETITLSVEDLTFKITHASAYVLMLFCMDGSLDKNKENLFELKFDEMFCPCPKPPRFLKELTIYKGAIVSVNQHSDVLTLRLKGYNEYELSRNEVFNLLYSTLKEHYGVYMYFPEMEVTSETRRYYSHISGKDALLYPIKEGDVHISTEHEGKVHWLYLAFENGFKTSLVWLDDNDPSKPVGLDAVDFATGAYLGESYSDDDIVIFTKRRAWVSSYRKNAGGLVKVFTKFVGSPALAY